MRNIHAKQQRTQKLALDWIKRAKIENWRIFNATPVHKMERICPVVAIVVSLIVGLPTILVGCNSFYPVCVHYNLYPNAIILNRQIGTETCSECVAYGQDNQCTATEYYDCYSANIEFKTGNSTCQYKAETYYRDYNKAVELANSYHLGDEREIYVEKNKPGICTANLKLVRDLSIVGITFVSLASLVSIVWFVAEVIRCI